MKPTPRSGGRSRILVVSPSPIPSFAQLDAELLSRSYDVARLAVSGVKSLFQVWKSLGHCDAMLVWFLGRAAFPAIAMARIRQVPVLSVIGGFEVAWVKELSYGIAPGSAKERMLRWMITASHSVLTVSNYSRGEAVARFPDLESRFKLIPNAVNTREFCMTGESNRKGVISVGAINKVTIGRKSWNLVRETARLMPDCAFTIIGKVGDVAGREFVRELPANTTWCGEVTRDELIRALQSSSVYYQPSIHEAFCVSLAEAMACGCFPVVSNRAALPEVVGGEGTCLRALDPHLASDAIRAELSRPETDRTLVRDRIVGNFGTDQRSKLLTAEFNRILGP